MSKIAVVYWSGTGNTEAMANFVAEGATGAGAEAEVISCADFSADKAANYDAIAFGCPAMGSEELEYDEFQPMWDEVKETLGDKKVVLFGSYSWAEGEWMDNWKADADEAGVNVVDSVICYDAPDDKGRDRLQGPGSGAGLTKPSESRKATDSRVPHNNSRSCPNKNGDRIFTSGPRLLYRQPRRVATRYCPRTPWCARSWGGRRPRSAYPLPR